MVDYPRSHIYPTSLLEASKFQGAITLCAIFRFLLRIRIYSAHIQTDLQNVTTHLVVTYLRIFGFALQHGGNYASGAMAGVHMVYCMPYFVTRSTIPGYVLHNITVI